MYTRTVKKVLCYLAGVLGFLFLFMGALILFFNLSAIYELPEIEVWALEGTDAYSMYSAEILCAVLAYWIIPIISFVIAFPLLKLFRHGRRKRGGSIETFDFDSNAPFIVYLRSFNDDILTAKERDTFLKPGQTEEMSIISILDDIAPVIAIGRPGEKYLPEGASRLYVSDEEWQETVTDLVSKAEFIVLRIGETEGLMWEVELCLKLIDLRKLLFIIPASKNKTAVENLYRRLNDHGIMSGDIPGNIRKTSKGSVSGFIYFSDEMKPVFKRLKNNRFLSVFSPLEDVMRDALTGFIGRFGGRVRKHSVTTRAKWLWAASIFLVLIMTANSVLKYMNWNITRVPGDLIQYCEESEEIAARLERTGYVWKTKRIFLEAIDGVEYLEDGKCLDMFYLTTRLIDIINDREFWLLTESLDTFDKYPGNLMILAKKYFNEDVLAFYLQTIKECAYLNITVSEAGNPEIPETELNDMKALIEERQRQNPDFHGFTDEEFFRDDVRISRDLLLSMYEEGYDTLPFIRALFLII